MSICKFIQYDYIISAFKSVRNNDILKLIHFLYIINLLLLVYYAFIGIRYLYVRPRNLIVSDY